MEKEIDLRSFVNVLLRHWIWIIGLALMAAVAAYIISSLLPRIYQASAALALTPPRYQMQFDPRFETAAKWIPESQAFPTLATSDGILQNVVDDYVPSAEAAIENWRLAVLQGMVKASSGGGSSFVMLQVRSRPPHDAAAIANLWAATITRRAKEIYSGTEKDVAFFDEQVSQSAQALGTADAALTEFEGSDESSIISAQLDSNRQAQADYLSDQRMAASMIQDIQGLRDQLAQQPGNPSTSVADNLTALLLQIKAFNAQSDAPVGLQIDGSQQLSNKSVAEQIAFLDSLVTTLQAKSGEIETRLKELEPQILSLQEKLQAINSEHDRLVRTQELAGETYQTLTRKLDEVRIAAQEDSGVLQVASYAAVPETPIRPRKLFNVAVAGTLGLMIGVLVAFSLDFWHRNHGQVQGTVK